MNVFSKSYEKTFSHLLQESLPTGVTIEHPIIDLMDWLEARGQRRKYRRSNREFLGITLVDSIDELWSHLSFQIDPDFSKYWLDHDAYSHRLNALVRCGADGSFLCLWEDNDGNKKFVFAGSEGEAKIIARDAIGFVQLITMGYCSIEEYSDLSLTPAENYCINNEDDWPEPEAVKQWVQDKFNVSYPLTGKAIINEPETGQDEFEVWLNEIRSK